MVTSSISKFVSAFVLIIIGVIFTTVVATQTNTVTGPTQVVDESMSLASARIGAANNSINTSVRFVLSNLGLADAGGWVTDSVVITNASGFSLAGNYTVNYNNETIYWKNNSYMQFGGGAGNNTLVDYQYYPAGYLNSDFGRSAVNLIGGFFSLALLGVGVWLFFSIAKEYKIV